MTRQSLVSSELMSMIINFFSTLVNIVVLGRQAQSKTSGINMEKTSQLLSNNIIYQKKN